jgi:hypothetical protein
MIRAEILDALLEAGATAEMIVAAVKAASRDEEARRADRRARNAASQRRLRQARRSHSRSSPVSMTVADRNDAPPNDNNSNPPRHRSSDEDLPPELIDRVVTSWNESAAKAGALPCRGINAKRREGLRARRREHGEAALFEAIRNLAGSEFHCGRNPRGWRATLGWLLGNAETFQGMLELTPMADAQSPPLTAEERIASIERSAALFEKMGRADEAAEMRRTAEGLRRTIDSQGDG